MTQKLSLAAALILALGAALWLGQSRTPEVTDLGPLAASAQEAYNRLMSRQLPIPWLKIWSLSRIRWPDVSKEGGADT